MIEVKTNMTNAEIDEAERQNERRRKKAIEDFKAGRHQSAETRRILERCDSLHQMLERMRKKAKR